MAVAAGIGVADLLYMAGAALAGMILVSPAGQQATKQAVQGTVEAINNLSQSQEKLDAPTVPTITEQCKEKEKEKDPCKDLKEQIEETIDELKRRWYQYQEDEGGLPDTKPDPPDPRYGTRTRPGERNAYEETQQRLRNQEEEWNEAGCGPDLPDVWEWLTRQLEGGSTNPYDRFPPK
jgi:hypothetical protein